MIDKVIDHLYLSDAGSVIGLRSKRNLSEHQITHVLTISASPINDDKKVEGVSYMFVFALDMLCQDLLGNNLLESTLSFIEDAIEEGGNVLVHCEAGVSRSVTVVAAYLMRKFEWPVEKAILFVQHARPIAGPNPGFMRQLNVFRAMGYRADPETLALAQEYRNWCADSGIIPQTGSLDGVQKLDATQNHRRKFKCRRCREPLFYDTNLMEHAQEARFSADFSGAKCSFGYLITPMEWMKLHNNEEKISCPSCGEKLGQYIASGKRCLGGERQCCNRLVIPWIHIQKAKVDDCPNVAFGHIGRNMITHHTPSITITPIP